MQSQGMYLHTSKSTTNVDTFIDHFWSNIYSNTIFFNVIETYWSDHNAISLSFPSAS